MATRIKCLLVLPVILGAAVYAAEPRRNAQYLAPPERGQDWSEWVGQLRNYREATRGRFDDAIYRRADLKWMTGNFVCGFLFVYDRAFWDQEKREYRVGPLCDDARREFGGYDSVVLWHAYPRIGVDGRNQFDFFRDMPGGLEGVREVVRQFHERRVKVFVPYNPWDTGTDREKESDEQALARLIATIEADGIFLDTMAVAPTRLREAVDAVRPGVAFEPEGQPSLDEMQRCSGSWAQWFQPFPGVGVLQLKWIEPRHMQHQIRRWDKSHQDELAAAWLNGSGVLVWENIFGYWNPWNAEDRATLRRMAPILRNNASLLAEGEWLPCFPTKIEKVHASCWQGPNQRLWTFWNDSGRKADDVVLEIEDQQEQFFDLWRGVPIEAKRADGKARLRVKLERFGAIGTSALPQAGEERMDSHSITKPILEPKAPPYCPPADGSISAGMLKVPGGKHEFIVRHMRRECGCYPDPGTPPERWDRFLTGNPHNETIEHRITASVASCWIDPKPVTNGQFAEFVKTSGYKPRCPDKFLHHWNGSACPPKLRDKPVVYVDLTDARAYAAWAKKRLPTEWEWHAAARQHGDAFERSEVREWTESERDDGHTRFVMLRGGSRYEAKGSIWYVPSGPQPIESHAKFILLDSSLDRCATIGFRCVVVP